MLARGFTKIAGVGAYHPAAVVKSDELMAEVRSENFGFPTNFISRIVGIHERRWSSSDVSRADLALHAARSALSNASTHPNDIDLIIYCGIESDYAEPSTAHFVQNAIDAHNAVSFDLSNACMGIMSGIQTANAYIGCGGFKNALICSGEMGSRVIELLIPAMQNATSRSEFASMMGGLTMGDAGAAFVLTEKQGETGFSWFNTISKGQWAKLCWYRKENGSIQGQMDMGNISSECIKAHKAIMPQTYNALGWSPDEVTSLCAHQVGIRPHRKLCSSAGVPLARAANTHQNLGNIASATLAPALIKTNPQPGDKTLFMASASGISVGQAGHIF